MQTKETALNARRKMGSYLTDENGPETPDSIGVREGVREGVRQARQTLEGKSPNSMYLIGEKMAGRQDSYRGLRRDRPAKSEE